MKMLQFCIIEKPKVSKMRFPIKYLQNSVSKCLWKLLIIMLISNFAILDLFTNVYHTGMKLDIYTSSCYLIEDFINGVRFIEYTTYNVISKILTSNNSNAGCPHLKLVSILPA